MLPISTVGVVAQPRLESKGNTAHIVASGKPMLIIGGELGNSSASTLENVGKNFLHVQKLILNTVLQNLSVLKEME